MQRQRMLSRTDRVANDRCDPCAVEFYPAHHGFAVPDNGTYDAAAAARHWDALGRLYAGQLAGA